MKSLQDIIKNNNLSDKDENEDKDKDITNVFIY